MRGGHAGGRRPWRPAAPAPGVRPGSSSGPWQRGSPTAVRPRIGRSPQSHPNRVSGGAGVRCRPAPPTREVGLALPRPRWGTPATPRVLSGELSAVQPSGPGPNETSDFDHLYEATYPRIFRTLASMLRDVAAAEDCTQEAFLKAFKAWATWKRDAPVEAWLHRIAINSAISYERRRRLREAGALLRRLGRPPEPDPADQALGGDLLREL